MGYDHLRAGEWFEAVKLGHALRLLRHPAGYELQALGLAGLGEVAEAVTALEEGVEDSPGCWALWDLLGVYRAELGDLDGAHEALDEALLCPEPDQGLVHVHAAVALHLGERGEEALARLELCGDARRLARREALRASILNDLGRSAEAAEAAAAALEGLDREAESADPARRVALAEIHAALALAVWRLGHGLDEAIGHAQEALAVDGENGAARLLLRRLLGGREPLPPGSRPARAGSAAPWR